MNKSYLIPAESLSVEIDVRKSRFICHLSQANNAESAKVFINDVRLKYSDATHNCWAFQTEQPGSTRSIGCSDDGEPHGTAGKPMLTVLSHSKVGEIVAVVTRYYGGIKLGTGGLARAYSDSVKAALEKLELCEKVDWKFAKLCFDYSLQNNIETILAEQGAQIVQSQFEDKVCFEIRFDLDSLTELNRKLSNISQGTLNVSLDKQDG
ncbi:MAG: putative YigZ family protein [Enterobacterales bacterium]|jgi:uncharacterized YigZ family protein